MKSDRQPLKRIGTGLGRVAVGVVLAPIWLWYTALDAGGRVFDFVFWDDHSPRWIRVVKTTAVVLVLAVAFVVLVILESNGRHRDANSALVRFYCQAGAVSRAQEHGCEAHVSAAQVNGYANRNDPTAIQAEQQLRNYQDAEDGQ